MEVFPRVCSPLASQHQHAFRTDTTCLPFLPEQQRKLLWGASRDPQASVSDVQHLLSKQEGGRQTYWGEIHILGYKQQALSIMNWQLSSGEGRHA